MLMKSQECISARDLFGIAPEIVAGYAGVSVDASMYNVKGCNSYDFGSLSVSAYSHLNPPVDFCLPWQTRRMFRGFMRIPSKLMMSEASLLLS